MLEVGSWRFFPEGPCSHGETDYCGRRRAARGRLVPPVRRVEAGVVSWGRRGVEGRMEGGRWQERGVERGISCLESWTELQNGVWGAKGLGRLWGRHLLLCRAPHYQRHQRFPHHQLFMSALAGKYQSLRLGSRGEERGQGTFAYFTTTQIWKGLSEKLRYIRVSPLWLIHWSKDLSVF